MDPCTSVPSSPPPHAPPAMAAGHTSTASMHRAKRSISSRLTDSVYSRRSDEDAAGSRTAVKVGKWSFCATHTHPETQR